MQSPEPASQGRLAGVFCSIYQETPTTQRRDSREALFSFSCECVSVSKTYIMSTELSKLDKAERGESHDLVGGKSGRNYGKDIHSVFERAAQPTMAQAQMEDLGKKNVP